MHYKTEFFKVKIKCIAMQMRKRETQAGDHTFDSSVMHGVGYGPRFHPQGMGI